MDGHRAGVIAMVLCCAFWGLSPLYYKLLADVPTLEVLAHRTFWALIFFVLYLGIQGRLRALFEGLRDPGTFLAMAFAAAVIAVNWFLFILSVQNGRTTEASLAYYIFPLVAVLFGMAAFGEKLGRLQAVAVALAAIAVAILTLRLGHPPWYALTIAVSFGLYGVAKKRLKMGPVMSVAGEVLLVLPLSAGWLFKLHAIDGTGIFGQDWGISFLLMLSGPLTSVPLILFSYASQRVSMATLGLIQYLNPTLQFLVAVAIFREPFGAAHAVSFALIWAALAIYSTAVLRDDRKRRKASMAPPTSSAT
ncbi:EamA-like transporter family protein [Roseivivax sp. THAF40]|uniref:EamA family transporter RarD n=1 Tax=unclassified Roseivivax TaxID=2639302 RepID=UPI0012AA956A|nr:MULTISPECIES: EamA family transporter RarD [unclassified Roseivivax]QFS82965.1 EamA-like transporter family protein [Roseivivax sp. THAF197b]QFT46736.1 EamA-like transporter family protein [Roseivivax sp. THAF40]